MEDLWTPYEGHTRRERPTTRKVEGGSIFDDELATEESKASALAEQAKQLLVHLNQRPDHKVYVGSSEERNKMREVFNWWYKAGALTHHPDIRIEYGVVEGAIRVAE